MTFVWLSAHVTWMPSSPNSDVYSIRRVNDYRDRSYWIDKRVDIGTGLPKIQVHTKKLRYRWCSKKVEGK